MPIKLYVVKSFTVLFIFCLFTESCSTSKRATPVRNSSNLTAADKLRGGTAFSNAVIIMVKSEREVLDEEYKWLSYSFPGYGLIVRNHKVHSAKHYDIVRIKTKQGQIRDVYFDSTSFWANQ
ncbi:MAG: hypothetical protein QM764_03570 [Chitinophagaceae bacterium]